jgi:hypothetical protein
MNTEKLVVRANCKGFSIRRHTSKTMDASNSRQATSRYQHPASGMSQATVWTTATKGKQEKKTGNLATAGMSATGHPQHQDTSKSRDTSSRRNLFSNRSMQHEGSPASEEMSAEANVPAIAVEPTVRKKH